STKDRSSYQQPTIKAVLGEASASAVAQKAVGVERLPSGGSYTKPSAPAAPSTVTTTVEGRMQQPATRGSKAYHTSQPYPEDTTVIAPQTTTVPDQATNPAQPQANTQPAQPAQPTQPAKGHKRANTVGSQSD